MSLRIYNTLTGRKEEFEPLRPPEVGMYVCGVTVYDECHLGHARAYVSFDVIARYLAFCGYRVRYVRNVTDVDDKIIHKSLQERCTSQEIAQRYYGEFVLQMRALGLGSPGAEPRATDHIQEMIVLIRRLLEKGCAYAVGGDVFFEVAKFQPYGRLSKRAPDDMMAGARVEVDGRKKSPLDFALWKAAKPGEPSWESPWGKGRPGWHIECSAMSMKFLGETFDIHGGGQDLIFPHHENEIAQSGAATGKPLTRFWVHNGFVMFKSHKMSKSLGNVFTLSKLFEKFPPQVVKFFLLTKHYRSPLEFEPAELEEAAKNLEKIDNALGLAQKRLHEAGSPLLRRTDAPLARDWESSLVVAEFCDAMDDDFNTPRALAVLHEQVGVVHADLQRDADIKTVGRHAEELTAILDVLGVPSKPLVLKNVSRVQEISEKEEARLLARTDLSEDQIVCLIEARNRARQTKDFSRADRIRKGLAQKGILLRDEKGCTTWAHGS